MTPYQITRLEALLRAFLVTRATAREAVHVQALLPTIRQRRRNPPTTGERNRQERRRAQKGWS